MRKLLIFITVAASAWLGGCSAVQVGATKLSEAKDLLPSFGIERLPLVYRPEILQGNLLSSQQLEALKVGMSRREVRFVLGTPMLDDLFHADRWDFAYTQGVGSKVKTIKRMTLHFEGDKLARIEGDYAPDDVSDRQVMTENEVFSVPDWVDPGMSLLQRLTRVVGLPTTEIDE